MSTDIAMAEFQFGDQVWVLRPGMESKFDGVPRPEDLVHALVVGSGVRQATVRWEGSSPVVGPVLHVHVAFQGREGDGESATVRENSVFRTQAAAVAAAQDQIDRRVAQLMDLHAAWGALTLESTPAATVEGDVVVVDTRGKCPACGTSVIGWCKCPGPHTLVDLRAGHGRKCVNRHRFDIETGLTIDADGTVLCEPSEVPE